MYFKVIFFLFHSSGLCSDLPQLKVLYGLAFISVFISEELPQISNHFNFVSKIFYKQKVYRHVRTLGIHVFSPVCNNFSYTDVNEDIL